MNTHTIDAFNVIGIAVKTSNNDYEKLHNDMQGLWNKLISENIADKISNKIDQNIYCVYTDYEGDHTKPYTALLGFKVTDLDNIPAGLIGKSFKGGLHNKYIVKGNLMQGIVLEEWKRIWSSDIPRKYAADFEIYGIKAQNPYNAEVEIFISIK